MLALCCNGRPLLAQWLVGVASSPLPRAPPGAAQSRAAGAHAEHVALRVGQLFNVVQRTVPAHFALALEFGQFLPADVNFKEYLVRFRGHPTHHREHTTTPARAQTHTRTDAGAHCIHHMRIPCARACTRTWPHMCARTRMCAGKRTRAHAKPNANSAHLCASTTRTLTRGRTWSVLLFCR
jgi:hypothetical protein